MTKRVAIIVISHLAIFTMVRGYFKMVLKNDGTAMCMTMIENFDKIKLGRQIVKMVKEIVTVFTMRIMMIL